MEFMGAVNLAMLPRVFGGSSPLTPWQGGKGQTFVFLAV